MANVRGTGGNDVIAINGAKFGFLPGVFTTEGVVGEPTNLADNIFGNDGNDVIAAGGGNDSVLGGLGDDIIYGGAGDDTLKGQGGDDRVFGGKGNDLIRGALGNDKLFGGKGNDRMFGGRGNDLLVGGEGADTLTGTFRRASNPGNGEIDILKGGGGADTFVLAFNNNVFYDNQGINDYAIIEDFESIDKIDLGGLSSADFDINAITSGNSALGIPSVSSIVYNGDLVALVVGDEITVSNFV